MNRRVVVIAAGVAVALVAALVVVLVVVRGGSDGTDDLAARVVATGETQYLTVVDLEEVRSVLDLPDDADLTEAGLDDDADRLFRSATVAFPHLIQLSDPGIVAAFDLGQVSAVATNGGRGAGGVTVMATDQPFDDLAAALEPLGYERDGDLLVYPDPDEAAVNGYVYTAIGATDGMIVMSSDREDGAGVVERALEEPDGDTSDDELLTALDELDGPVTGLVRGTECVSVYAIDDPLGSDATLSLFGDDPDDITALVEDDEPFDSVTVGDPEVVDDRVELSLETDLERVIGGPVIFAVSREFVPSQIYSCA